jgi:hypothetical protein
MRWAVLGCALFLTGCGGMHYWTKPNATTKAFLADHEPCFKDATIGYGVGSEKAYKACMTEKGWVRVQGYVNGPPTVPHWRGPEDDESFKPADAEWYRPKLNDRAIQAICRASETTRG